MSDPGQYPIPDPGAPDLSRPLAQISYSEALSEQAQMSEPWSPKWRGKWDWTMRFILRPVLFVIVVALSWWWSVNVSRLVWQTAAGRLRLESSVLIALVTTSMGNFIALIVIIARHLFPEDRADKK